MKLSLKIALVFLAGVLAAGAPVKAQDFVVNKDGTRVEAINIVDLEDEVKYQRADNPNGPVYRVHKTDLLRIDYANDERPEGQLYSGQENLSDNPVILAKSSQQEKVRDAVKELKHGRIMHAGGWASIIGGYVVAAITASAGAVTATAVSAFVLIPGGIGLLVAGAIKKRRAIRQLETI